MSILEQNAAAPRYNWAAIQSFYDAGNLAVQCKEKFGFSDNAWVRAIKAGRLVLDPARSKKKGVSPGGPDYNPIGRRFGKLVVVSRSSSSSGTRWSCNCDCGQVRIAKLSELNCGNSKSCGCDHHRSGPESRRWSGCGQLAGGHWGQIVENAVRRGIPVGVNISQAWSLFEKQKGRCALSGTVLTLGTRKAGRTASLDRIDSALGYVVGNIQWTHKAVNLMKGSMSDSLFLEWVESISKFNRSQKE